jgi:hypothetical protein
MYITISITNPGEDEPMLQDCYSAASFEAAVALVKAISDMVSTSPSIKLAWRE